ncbi:hypothetical protein BGX33_001939 [Mortierella sp. NVP41]|nr:hypothetical protein BGX33_001939 [Mortierella sp. NVP41]
MSEHLVKVKVHDVHIRNRQGFGFLAEAVSRIPRLEVLDLTVYLEVHGQYSLSCAGAWSDLFFVCPPSIRKLEAHLFLREMDADTGEQQQAVAGDDNDNDGSDKNAGGKLVVPKRQAPLQHLMDLLIPFTTTEMTMEEVKSILSHCYKLESVYFYRSEPNPRNHDFATIVATCCPLLKRLTFGSVNCETGSSFPHDLMVAVKEQQVEEFKWTVSPRFDGLGGVEATIMFRRHSRTLRKVVFEMFAQTSSEALCAVLFVCEALEEFRVQWYDDTCKDDLAEMYILLWDAVREPWVCTRLRHLKVPFEIALLDDGPDYVPYYNSMSVVSLSDREQEQFGLLKQLYRQIGSLTKLSYLDLRTLVFDDHGLSTLTPCHRCSFPALLSLGDGEWGRPGYLALLGGLTKLRELRGSVYADRDETVVTMGWSEARWIAAHWPRLEVTEFFRPHQDPTEPFRWLQEQYKDGQLALTVHRR